MSRGKHVLALVVSLATAVLPLWVDPAQTLVGKIAGSIVTGLLLAVSTEKLRTQRNAILGGLACAAIVATAVMGKFTPGSLGLAVVGNLAAVVAQLRVVLAKELAEASPVAQPRDAEKGDMSIIVAIVLAVVSLFLGLSYSYPARADTPISKCWTSICAEPQVSVSVVEYNLATHKIGAGILPVGSVGYGIRDVNDYVAAGLYLSTSIGGGAPNYVAPAVLVRFMRAITIGVQVRAGEDVTQWSLLAGGGFGL